MKGIYDNKYFSFNIELDQYFPIDSSPALDTWNSSKKILSKIKYLNYKSNSGSIVYFWEIVRHYFGHGLVLKDIQISTIILCEIIMELVLDMKIKTFLM